jgi:transitional endoplasmic reticulum ATPase
MGFATRPYRSDDLARIIELSAKAGEPPASTPAHQLGEVLSLVNHEGTIVLVAEQGGEIVGAGFGTVSGAVGWIHDLAIADQPEADAVLAGLIDEMGSVMADRGAHTISSLVARDGRLHRGLQQKGYEMVRGAICFRREVSRTVSAPAVLAELGGVMVDPGLWGRLKGMDEPKDIIERRVILPLSEPALAERHGVERPNAIVLFGPPGTGKTTFAKGIASRLGWPFVEIEPSELVVEGIEHEGRLLARAFERLLELPSAVVFVDEVEDIASIRHQERRVSPSVTNEFLKQIPRFRGAPHHLLVCATNGVGTLDPAFLRPGRFDYVLPVGPPDGAAREAIWRRYVAEITDRDVDVEALVEASTYFTPADIEFAARKAAQSAFEREVFEGSGARATTDDFLDAIRQSRPTLSQEMIEVFKADVEQFARY